MRCPRALPARAALLALALTAGGRVAPAAPASGDPARPLVRVGVLLDAPLTEGSQALGLVPRREMLSMIEEEVLALVRRDFDVRFPEEKRVAGAWTLDSVRDGLETLLADPDVEMVLAVGPLSAVVACQWPEPSRPLFALPGIDVEAQALPLTRDGTSGVSNLNYATIPASVAADLSKFRELLPFRRVHIISDAAIAQAIPGITAYTLSVAERIGIEEIVPLFVTDTVDEALRVLREGAEAVYVTPIGRLPQGEIDRLVSTLKELRLPSFALLGRPYVERGFLAGVMPPSDLARLARRMAINIHRTLLGEDPGTLPVLLEGTGRLTLNMETARAIRWYPRWRILTEAELLNEEPRDIRRTVSLASAIEEAWRANLDLQARERLVAAGREDPRRARSALLPRLEASVSGLLVDEERAAASLGSQPERSVSAGATLSQVLYSDPLLSSLRIEERLQLSREAERDALRLDVARDAAVAFLDVLRARTLEKIRKDNLRLTETNLEIARRRRQLGVTGPAEVFRWESQLATARREVIDAGARLDATRAALNRLLHRPLEQRFLAEEPSLEELGLTPGTGPIERYVGNPWAFEVFRAFHVEEALSRSPELRSLDAARSARQRALRSARRAFWSPTLALQGDLTRQMSEGGAGTDAELALELPPPVGAVSFRPPQADETRWSVALGLSLPLLTGGERASAFRKAREELGRVEIERDAAAERVEFRVRATLYRTSASFPAIEFTREAAEAARRNFELVQDLYSRGVVSIIDLLDAQNAYLVSDLAAANVVYDFLADLVEVLRAGANIEFLVSAAERAAWFGRLEAFFAEVGGPSGPSGR